MREYDDTGLHRSEWPLRARRQRNASPLPVTGPSIIAEVQRLAGNRATAGLVDHLRPSAGATAVQRNCGRAGEARALAEEIRNQQKTGIGKKDLQGYLKQKDALVGRGKHHAKRNVSAGQIANDLENWADKHE